jgi:predicted methyltransferase
MVVFDMLAGDGYYSEIAARVTGRDGKVYLHNNQGYRGLMTRVPTRVRGDRLPNLEVYVREINDINLPSNSVDMVLLVKVYHDLYYVNNGWNVPPEPFFHTIWRILKPGGVLAVIDHRAPDGSGSQLAQNLHRIDPSFARQDIESRGFEWLAESAVLDNPLDDLTGSPFGPAFRGQTARFVHRYQKID